MFQDLTKSMVTLGIHTPLILMGCKPKRIPSSETFLAWHCRLTSLITIAGDSGEPLPDLPLPFASDYDRALEAIGGGVALRSVLQSFKRAGQIDIGSGPDVVEIEGARCSVNYASLAVSEGKAQTEWHLVLALEPEQAGPLVSMLERQVWVDLHLSDSNPQLTLFGDRPQGAVIKAQVDQ